MSTNYVIKKNFLNKKFLQMLHGVQGKKNEVEKFKKMKDSKPFLNGNSNALYYFRHLAAFSADSVHLKKPSRWPEGPK